MVQIKSKRGNGILDNPDRGKQLHTKESIAKRIISIKNAHKSGKYAGSHEKGVKTRRSKFHDGVIKISEEARENCRIGASKSNHQRVSKRSHKFVDKLGREFIFDSSWEDATAIRLDELNINWIRPEPIPYFIDGRVRNYFPDFYLPDYNTYIDPKNPYVEQKQKEKIGYSIKTNKFDNTP